MNASAQALAERRRQSPTAVHDCFIMLAMATLANDDEPVDAQDVGRQSAALGPGRSQHTESIDCTLTMAVAAGIVQAHPEHGRDQRGAVWSWLVYSMSREAIAAMMKLGVVAWIERALGITNNEGSGTST